VTQIEIEWANLGRTLAQNPRFAIRIGLEADIFRGSIEVSAQNFPQIGVGCGKTKAIPIEMKTPEALKFLIVE
jgi:hypothetical protein